VKAGICITVLAALALTATAGATRPRPDAIPPGQVYTDIAPSALRVYNDYATPARVYDAARVDVHYVTQGPDAPPLNDDDADGVPDYVQRVAAAADTAVAYFERRGFAPIAADAAGPDSSPDIYISRFTPGYFGVAFPATEADGGAFVAVANSLDPSPSRSLGSVDGTVAHELFHLVQFSASSRGSQLPSWVLEGMAAAMENRVFPSLDDIVASLQLRGWFASPQHRITEQSYGSQLLWGYLDLRVPHLLLTFLREARRPSAEALARTYGRLTGRSFREAFHRFALWVAGDYPERLTPLRLADGSTGAVPPLAVHYLRVPRAARHLRIRLAGRANASVMEERMRRPGLPPLVRRLQCVDARCTEWAIPRGGAATLVVSNGNAAGGVRYQVWTEPL
jgi:hypothetical protein